MRLIIRTSGCFKNYKYAHPELFETFCLEPRMKAFVTGLRHFSVALSLPYYRAEAKKVKIWLKNAKFAGTCLPEGRVEKVQPSSQKNRNSDFIANNILFMKLGFFVLEVSSFLNKH